MADKLSREDLIAACKITINQFEDSAMAVEAVLTALEEKSEAEEFRTPKKVKTTDSFHTYDDGTQEPHKEYQCPTCNRILSVIGPHGYMMGHFGAWYCEYCGQALDWTEVKEDAENS